MILALQIIFGAAWLFIGAVAAQANMDNLNRDYPELPPCSPLLYATAVFGPFNFIGLLFTTNSRDSR